MKNIPKKIYLQIGGDCKDPDLDFNSLQEVSWCNHNVHGNDIEYFRKKQLVAEEIHGFQESIDNMPQSSKDKVDNTLLVQELLPMLRQFIFAQGRMQDDYAESSEERKAALWKDLHTKGNAVRNFLDEQNLMIIKPTQP